jgi:hypothetical protein
MMEINLNICIQKLTCHEGYQNSLILSFFYCICKVNLLKEMSVYFVCWCVNNLLPGSYHQTLELF